MSEKYNNMSKLDLLKNLLKEKQENIKNTATIMEIFNSKNLLEVQQIIANHFGND